MMSMWPRSSQAIPATTAQVARAAFPQGCLAIRIRDTLGELFADAQFAQLFATRGRPAVSPARLALVLVLQFAEGLSDRQAADTVRGRIDWKYVLGLELSDIGFTPRCSGSSALGCLATTSPSGCWAGVHSGIGCAISQPLAKRYHRIEWFLAMPHPTVQMP
jgi:Transposase domain (DUF772)